MVWVGPETVTSLIEAHGTAPDACFGPTGRATPAGRCWSPRRRSRLSGPSPPIGCRRRSSTTSRVRRADRHLELGDPGVTYDRDTARADLPPVHRPDRSAGRPRPRVGRPGRRRGGRRRRSRVRRWRRTPPRPATPRRLIAGGSQPPGSRLGLRRRAPGEASRHRRDAIPPITRPTPRSWADDGASPSSTIASATVTTGWDEQDDRGHDGRQPRQRQRDQQVAEELRRDARASPARTGSAGPA